MGISIDFKESGVQANDLANRAIVGMVLHNSSRFMLHCVTTNASWVTDRLLKAAAYPMAQVRFKANRNLFNLEVGDVFKFSYKQYGLTRVVFRIISIREANIESEEILIDAIEDIDYISSNLTTQAIPGLAETEDWDLFDLAHTKTAEAPYLIVENEIRIIPLAARETNLDLGYYLYMSEDGGTSYSNIGNVDTFNPYGTLVSDYSEDTYQIDDTVGFEIDFYNDDVDQINTITRTALFGGTNSAVLGDETITFQTIIPVSGTRYKLENIYRGRWDTERVDHTAGEDFYFLGLSNYRVIENVGLLVGTDRKFKLIPYNMKNVGSLATATVNDLSIVGRSRTPYTPYNLSCSGIVWKPTYTDDIALEWSGRVRGEWAGTEAETATDESPFWEGLFKVEVTVSGSIVRTTTGIDADEWTYTEAYNLSDNTTLANELQFDLYNYITYGGITYTSSGRNITVKKE